ncbi:MAG TPA: MdtA/MuxA family multidrug efflux RND transporter periplasmic adaptor subunit [Terriglobales bacterium]
MLRFVLQSRAALQATLAIFLAAFLAGCGNTAARQQSSSQTPGRGQGQQAVSVAVAPAEVRDVPVYLTGLGSVDAFNTVTVKSRIDGQLMTVAFKEGQQVKKGELLAVIDPRPYEVQLSQAQATLFKDNAALKDARANLARFQGLFNEGIVPRQQLDSQTALVGQLEGTVSADQAQIDTIKLNLVYTRITAPVSGRVGLRQVDAGNIVHASDASGLVVITQLQPIAVLFTLPQENLPAVSRRMHSGPLPVDAFSQDNQTKIASGKLVTIDNEIDPTTGTGKLKAVFDNRDNVLWPNQFVNVRMLLEVRKNNTVVPAAAVQRGPEGTYIYVVKPDKTAELRPVAVGFTQGNFASISKGVSPGEVVVTDGQDKLQAGSRVEPRSGAAPAPAKAAASRASS